MTEVDFGTYDPVTNRMPVTQEGTLLGYIRANAWGWFFVSSTKKSIRGKLFKDVSSVKRAIEGDTTVLFPSVPVRF